METKPAPPEKPAAARSDPRGSERFEVPAAEPKPSRSDGAPFRWLMLSVLAIIAAPLTAMLGLPLLSSALFSFPPPGEVPYEEWPHYLQREHAEWRKNGIDVQDMEVYATDAMFDSAAYCRLPHTPERWEYLKRRYGGPAEGSIDAERKHWSHVAAELPDWSPSVSDRAVEYAPFDDPNGEEGLSMHLAYDPGRGLIYLDYYLNF